MSDKIENQIDYEFIACMAFSSITVTFIVGCCISCRLLKNQWKEYKLSPWHEFKIQIGRRDTVSKFVSLRRCSLNSYDIEQYGLNPIKNPYGISPLDEAVLNNEKLKAKLLMLHGAQETISDCEFPECIENLLIHQLSKCMLRLKELGIAINLSDLSVENSSRISRGYNRRNSLVSRIKQFTICFKNDSKRYEEILEWEQKAVTLKKLLIKFGLIKPPDKPATLTISLANSEHLRLDFAESDSEQSSICTKFKLQCSLKKDFSAILRERIISDMGMPYYTAGPFEPWQKYYFRIAAGNLKGYGTFQYSSPAYIMFGWYGDSQDRFVRFGRHSF